VRRKKGRYKRGVHNSKKLTAPARYRSAWELGYMQMLDDDLSVLAYEYEPFAIEYVSNVKTKRIRRYFPDFLITKTDDSKVLVEIKPLKRLSTAKVVKKLMAAKAWCAQNNLVFLVITEVELKQMGVL